MAIFAELDHGREDEQTQSYCVLTVIQILGTRQTVLGFQSPVALSRESVISRINR